MGCCTSQPEEEEPNEATLLLPPMEEDHPEQEQQQKIIVQLAELLIDISSNRMLDTIQPVEIVKRQQEYKSMLNNSLVVDFGSLSKFTTRETKGISKSDIFEIDALLQEYTPSTVLDLSHLKATLE